jgi:lipopolysaccharide/colanic/teichoic acid biosynthesis glycosyltransferase
VTTADEPRSWVPFARPSRPHLVTQRALRDRSLALPLRLLSAVHGGQVGATAVVTDLVVLLACSLAVLGTSGWSLAAAALAALCLSGRVYRDRDRVVARGIAWWPGVLVGPVAVGVLADNLLTDHGAVPVAVAAVSCLAGLLAVRTFAWCVIAARRRAGRDLAVALVVGSGDRAATLARTLERHLEIGLRVGADVDPSVLRDPDRLAASALQHNARHIFLVPDQGVPSPPALRRALGVPVHVSYVPLVSDALLDSRPEGRVGGVAVLALGQPLRGPSAMRGKRAFDLVVGAVLLLLSAPLLVIAALAVRLDDGGPVFYKQSRTGRDGRQFLMTKLRTMRVGADSEQGPLTSYNTSDGLLFKMNHDPRVTRVGSLLRRTGADELPQLLDVLRGTMSLVGPRPLPVESDAFSERDRERHLVRPGMTGLWQVSGGSSLRYREMIDLDLAYVHAWTPWIDVQVLLSTIGVLLRATFGGEGRSS